MKKRVRTGHGTSVNTIDPDKRRGGTGQGVTCGPQTWNAYLEPLSASFKQFSEGFGFTTPSRRKKFRQWLASIVDDVTILRTHDQQLSVQERIKIFTNNINTFVIQF